MLKKFLLVLIVGLFFACNPGADSKVASTNDKTENHDGHDHEGHDHDGHDHDGHDHDGHDHSGHDHDASTNNTFGEAFDVVGAVGYDAFLTQFKEVDSLALKVTGTVESVCQVKGCWMNIVSENPDAESMFVKFKDYGFFMPLDISGRKVVMDGYAFREVTSVDELKHYAEDEGKSADEIAAITEPLEELKFMASGVVLLDK